MVDAPKRIQRSRAKGWRMPPDTVYVGRPSKWGNPFPFGPTYVLKTPAESVAAYRRAVETGLACIPVWKDAIKEIRGQNLSCWCALDQPCHADVLLEIANG